MSEENALSVLDNLPVNAHVAEHFAEFSKGGFNFLPRLQLCSAGTTLAKEGKVPINHYALVFNNEQFEDLTKVVIVIPLVDRLKALDTSGDTPLSYYNPSLPSWRNVYERSKVSDSKCMAGPEFLVWLPEKKRFATFYLCAPTARPEAIPIKERLRLACQLEHKMLKNKKGQVWAVPLCKPYSSPVELPPEAQLRTEVERFVNEKDSEITMAEESTRER